LLFQIVTANLGAMIPYRAMDSAANQLVAQVDFLRSEARLQGKVYKLEIDLDSNRYRLLLPPEDLMVAPDASAEAFDLGWAALEDHVEVSGCVVAGGDTFRNGRYQIVFDESGFTADQTVFLRHDSVEDMVWSLQIRGLTGQSTIVRSMDGVPQPLEYVEESQF